MPRLLGVHAQVSCHVLYFGLLLASMHVLILEAGHRIIPSAPRKKALGMKRVADPASKQTPEPEETETISGQGGSDVRNSINNMILAPSAVPGHSHRTSSSIGKIFDILHENDFLSLNVFFCCLSILSFCPFPFISHFPHPCLVDSPIPLLMLLSSLCFSLFLCELHSLSFFTLPCS